jgi:hypothetical protein
MRHALRRLLGRLRRRRQIQRYLRDNGERKLQLGAADKLLSGWLNTDLHDYGRGELRERYVRWAAETLEPELHAPLPGAVINNFFRSWGHAFIYDPQTLRHALEQAGFVDIEERTVGELERHLAEEPQFNEYETFVLEARRPAP